MATWSAVFVHFYVNQFFINSPSGRITVLDMNRIPTEQNIINMSWVGG
jgi:hypothetical protein